MHAEGQLLVRDEHVPAVHEIFNPGVELRRRRSGGSSRAFRS